jgi:hypothetical protein
VERRHRSVPVQRLRADARALFLAAFHREIRKEIALLLAPVLLPVFDELFRERARRMDGDTANGFAVKRAKVSAVASK